MSARFPYSGIPSICRTNFVCAICKREIEMRWNRWGPDEILPPICLSCERWQSQGNSKPTAGSFRDRREVMRGFALAETLRTEAVWKQHGWGNPHAA